MAAVRLEDVDLVRERTGASYRVCYEALVATGGDVVQAVVRVEEGRAWWRRPCRQVGTGARAAAERLLQEAGRTRLSVRRGGREVFAMPALLATAAVALLPGAAAAGLLAAVATGSTVTLEHEAAAT
jgi:hypothetical protein